MPNSIAERNEFLRHIIEKMDIDYIDNSIRQEMFDFFMKCTGGKVYKYRSFDENGYAISNLKTGTLYCAPSASFNDPFDCKIGLDMMSLFIAKTGLNEDNVLQLLQKFRAVYTEESSIDEYSLSEQKAITYWLESENIKELLSNEENIETEQELTACILNNPDVIVDILCGAISDPSQSSSMEMSSKMITSIIKHIATNNTNQLFENMSFDDIARLSGCDADADEISKVGMLSDLYMPEKHEETLKMIAAVHQLEKTLKENIENSFFIGCLTDDYKNRLMWSHYANSHRGFCVEYDYCDVGQLNIVPLPVAYTRNRIKMPWKEFIENTPESLMDAGKIMMQAFLTKDDAWSYEREWRILINNTADANIKMPRVSCIYIGALCENSHRKVLIDIAAQLRIPIKQMTIDRGEYTLHAENIK